MVSLLPLRRPAGGAAADGFTFEGASCLWADSPVLPAMIEEPVVRKSPQSGATMRRASLETN